jgi:REP-associated tyrosine transposase
MSRKHRVQVSGVAYHVTARGNVRQDIYLDDEDRETFLGFLAQACEREHLICHAYCLMGNHYHLLAETPTGALSKAMHRLNSGYAKHFNREHETEGHLFERRYQSWIMGSQERAMEAVRYIVRNPVRAGLCTCPADWPWSSHMATAGDRPAPPFLTVGTVQGWFGAEAGQAVENYRAYVDAGVDAPSERPPLERVLLSQTLPEIAVANRKYGYSLREISSVVGLSPATLSRRLRDAERETLASGTGVSAIEQ